MSTIKSTNVPNEPPGDLTRALLELSRASGDRRHARKALREAATLVAGEILEHLRSGDEVVVATAGAARITYRAVRVTWQGSQWAGNVRPQWCPEPAVTLVRGDEALVDVRESWHDGSNTHKPFGPMYPAGRGRTGEADTSEAIHLAGADTQEAFAGEAAAVIAAFAALHREQAAGMRRAAEGVSKLSVR